MSRHRHNSIGKESILTMEKHEKEPVSIDVSLRNPIARVEPETQSHGKLVTNMGRSRHEIKRGQIWHTAASDMLDAMAYWRKGYDIHSGTGA